MPLLPGETRENEGKYVSGLSFIDDLGKSVKSAAERTQVSTAHHAKANVITEQTQIMRTVSQVPSEQTQ